MAHKILVKPVDGDLYEKVVDEDGSMYDAIRDAIGGWLEHIEITLNGVVVDVWLDEEGKLKSLPFNMALPGDALVGTLVFTGGADSKGQTLGLDQRRETLVRDMFAGQFTKVDWAY